MRDLKSLSKTNFTTDDKTLEHIQASCLMRIADASEAMASNHLKLLSDLEYLRDSYKRRGDRINKMEKQIAAYKGHISRLKKLNQPKQ